MGSLATSLTLGLRQVFDGAVLRILLKSLGVTIVLFLVVTTGGWFLHDWLLAWGGLEDALFTGAGAVRGALSAAGRALLANLIALPFALVLLFTGVGTFALFMLVNAVLLGGDLQDMVWLRHCHQRDACAPVSRGERFLLGGVVAAMLAVPFVNFLAPVLGAASANHLVHRKQRMQKDA